MVEFFFDTKKYTNRFGGYSKNLNCFRFLETRAREEIGSIERSERYQSGEEESQPTQKKYFINPMGFFLW